MGRMSEMDAEYQEERELLDRLRLMYLEGHHRAEVAQQIIDDSAGRRLLATTLGQVLLKKDPKITIDELLTSENINDRHLGLSLIQVRQMFREFQDADKKKE